jgi:hypothetical protein
VTFKPSAAQACSGTLEFKRSTGSTIWIALGGSGIGQPKMTAPVAPTISSQPAIAEITAGQTATFDLAATGTAPMTYQWKKNVTAIGGVTSNTDSIVHAGQTYFFVIASVNFSNEESAYSAEVNALVP